MILSNMALKGHNWRVADFCDTIPEIPGGSIGDLYGKSMSERNKCLVIHLAATSVCVDEDSDESLDSKYERAMSIARDIRAEQFHQARLRGGELGEPTSNDHLIVAELRFHVHDILNPNRDRVHKTLL